MRWAALILLAVSGSATAAPTDDVGQAIGAALQADMPRALQLLKNVDPTSLTEKDRKFAACVPRRFASSTFRPASGTGFVDRALAIYQRYWHASVMHPKTRDAREHQLEIQLGRLLHARAGTKMDALEPILAKRLEASGWHSLQGRTGLLRELMIWGKQDEKMMPVDLPDGQYRAKVEYLDGFKSFGWSHYATCGRAATGGWATEDALFAVVPRYEDLQGEEFRVSFLGHETQHFSDKARFKGLKDWEMEYRAKLVELAFADRTRAKVLGRFVDDQGADPASPHSYANRAVLSEMVKRLELSSANDLLTVDLARLHSAARDALLEDSRQRAAAAPTSVAR
ncbi:MAG TPA: hypothetical protein VF067_07700 [Sphingomicrobium sp.]